MKLMFFILIVASCISSSSFADSLAVSRPLKHSFQLEIGDYLSLHQFNNTWICYKLHFSSSSAIRIGLKLNANYGGNYTPEPQNYRNITEGAGFSLNPVYISYFYFHKVIKPYYGIGPYLAISYTDNSISARGSSTDFWKRKSIDIGINGLFGLEWFFHKNFSLFTEYGLVGVYSYYSSIDAQHGESLTKNFLLYNTNCLIGISIYL